MISVDITTPQVITLGRNGEYGEVNAVQFDITTYVDTLGEGTVTLYFRRIYGEAAYIPLNVSVSDGIVTWIPSETDLGVRSDSGYVEIRYEYNSGRAVSRKYRVIIKESLTDDITGDVSLGEQYLAEIAAYMQPILENHIIYSDFVDSMSTYKEDYPFAFSVNGYTGDVVLTYADVNALSEDTYIPAKVSDLENDLGFLTEHQDISGKANISDLSSVATSGDYDDLINKPQNISVFTNDIGYLLEHQDLSGKADVDSVYTKTETDELLNEYISEFVVTISIVNGTYSADKTFAELLSASETKTITCIYGNLKLPLLTAASSSIVFQDISMSSGIVTGTSITITSSNSVSITVEHLDEAVKSVNSKTGEIILEREDIGVFSGTTSEINALIANNDVSDGDILIITDDSPDQSDSVSYVLKETFDNAISQKPTVRGTPTDGQFLVYSSAHGVYVPTTVLTADYIEFGGTT